MTMDALKKVLLSGVRLAVSVTSGVDDFFS